MGEKFDPFLETSVHVDTLNVLVVLGTQPIKRDDLLDGPLHPTGESEMSRCLFQ